MTRQSVFRFLAALALLLFLLTMNSHARYRDSRRMQNEQSYILWYDRPASKWVEALALGNGRIGAMVHGGISEDRVCLNDNTLYSGEPGQRDLPLDITKDFDRVVGWLRAGKYAAAEKFATQHWGGRAQPYYQPLGDLNLQFPVERSIPFVF